MRRRLLDGIASLSLERPRLVLGVALALAAVGGAVLPSIDVVSSRFALIDEDGSVEAALRRYGAQGDLIVVVRAKDAGSTVLAARAVREGLVAEGVPSERVFHRIDGSWTRGHALDLLEPGQVSLLLRFARDGGPTDLRGVLEDALADLGATDEGVTLELLEDEPRAPAEPEAVLALAQLLDTIASGGAAGPAAGPAAERDLFDDAGHPRTDDGARLVFVSPAARTDRYEEVAPLVLLARRVAREVERTHGGVEVVLTGYPAIAVEEVEAVRNGSLVGGVFAAVLVIGLFVLGFRSRAGLVVAGVPLAVGMAMAFGMIALTVGRLNLLTQAAAPVFAGLGIDFAVHLVAAYEAARGRGERHEDATRSALRAAGPGIVTGGVTTAGAFFALTLGGYSAVAELGWIAGAGLLLVLCAVLIVTPALWTLGEQYGGHWTRVSLVSASARWQRWAQLVTGRAAAVLGFALVVTVALGWGAHSLRFDADVEALMPADAESVVEARRLAATSAFTNELLLIERGSISEVRALEAQLGELASVGSVLSAARFVPGHGASNRALVAAWRAEAEEEAESGGESESGAEPESEGESESGSESESGGESELEPERDSGSEAEPERDSGSEAAPESEPESRAAGSADAGEEATRLLRALAQEADGASEEVARVGSESIADALGTLARSARDASERLAAHATPTDVVGDTDAAIGLFLEVGVAALEEADPAAPALSVEALPEELRRRFVHEDGRLAVYVRPEGRVLEGDRLASFVSDVQGVAPDATGYPVALLGFGERVPSGMQRALGVAAFVVLLILALDFRRASDVLLALVPVTLGALWLLGVMGWLGLAWNPASLAALPVIVGIGVDDGVHLVHRRRSAESSGAALAGLGRTLVLTTATTVAGFGTLVVAEHRGMQSFALTMVIGAVGCLVATLVVLPALQRLVTRA